MPLVKKITKHGNSAGVILDQPILKQVGWEIGTELEIRIDGHQMILTRHQYASDEDVKASAERMFKRHAKSLERLAK